MLRARVSAAIRFCVRGSSRPSDGGGAKCSTRERRRAQALEARETIQVADNGNDAVRAQFRHVFGAPGQPVQANPRMEQIGSAQRDVTAADQEYADHAGGRMVSNWMLQANCATRVSHGRARRCVPRDAL